MSRRLLLLALIALPLAAQDFSANAARQLRAPRKIRLHNQPVLLQSAHVWNDGETVTWNGIVDNPLPGSFSLAISGNIVEGILTTASGETFAIGGRPDELTYTAVPNQPFLCPVAPTLAKAEAPLPGPRQLDSDNQVDILVAYSAAARARSGSALGITNTIRGAVDYTNQAFFNSGIATTLNLVGVKEVTIAESGSCLFDLAQITNLGNTSGNELNSLRQQTGADLVSLIITDGDCAGIGYVLSNTTGNPDAAYSLTALNTSTTQLTFAHEIGHNLGAAHDRANSGGSGLFPYSYGYQNTTADPFFRDLMSYECAGAPCPRQPYFSNPNVRVFGRPTGVAASAPNSADVAATFALSAPVVANYRPRNPNPDPALVPAITVSPAKNDVPRAGGTFTVTIRASANLEWIARATPWLPIGEIRGFGNADIVVRVPANNTIGSRGGEVYLSPGNNINGPSLGRSSFVQDGVQATFIPSSIAAAAGPVSGQTRLVLSDESFPWTASYFYPGETWLTISPLSGIGSTTLTYTAAANLSNQYRSNGITIEGSYLFGVGQYNYTITPMAAAVTLPAAGGSATIPVSLNSTSGAWMATAFSSDQWLTATPSFPTQFQSLATFTATRNLSSADRFGTLTIGSETIRVRQLGQRCTLAAPISLGAVLNAQLAATPACGSSYLSNTQRAAYSNRYTFSGTAGQTVRILMESGVLDSVLYLTGPNNELLTQDDNSGGSNNAAIPNLTNFFVLPSTGTYTIEATSFSLGSFTLRLLGSTPAAATLLPTSLTVAPTAGTGTLALSLPAGLAWSATAYSEDEWLQVNPPTGSGNTTLSYSYFPNPSTTARTATIRAAGQTFTLTQSAAPSEERVLPSPPPLTGPGTRDTGPLYSIGKDSKHVYRFTHPAGFASLNVVNVLINTALDGGRACYIAYSRPAGVLYLVDDAGPDAGLAALTLGSNATVSNSQCTIHGADSSAVGSGNQLTLTLRIEFKPAFSGYRVVYLAARDAAGGNSGWNTHGGIAIPDLPATFPRSGPMQPSSGQSMQPFIRFSFQHEGATNNLGTAWVLMGTAVDARNACYVAYFAPGKLLLLLPDDGDASKATSMPIPSSGSLQNSQCTIYGSQSNLGSGQGELAFFLSILFNANFQHKQIGIWTATQTLATPGNPAKTSPWTIVGGWNPTRVGF